MLLVKKTLYFSHFIVKIVSRFSKLFFTVFKQILLHHASIQGSAQRHLKCCSNCSRIQFFGLGLRPTVDKACLMLFSTDAPKHRGPEWNFRPQREANETVRLCVCLQHSGSETVVDCISRSVESKPGSSTLVIVIVVVIVLLIALCVVVGIVIFIKKRSAPASSEGQSSEMRAQNKKLMDG